MNNIKYEKHLQRIKNRLKESRYIHTLNVLERALELSEIYGVNTEKVALASIYHDYAKNFTNDEIREYIEKNNLKLDEIVKKNIFLAHGFIAADILKNEIKDEEILNAIRYHTIARKDMSDVEKIVYIADATEKDRDYKNVEKLRKLSFIDIDMSILKYIDYFLEYAIKNKLIIHPNAIELRNQLINNKY